MHLFGGKFCNKTDGSNDACECHEIGRWRLRRVKQEPILKPDARTATTTMSDDDGGNLLLGEEIEMDASSKEGSGRSISRYAQWINDQEYYSIVINERIVRSDLQDANKNQAIHQIFHYDEDWEPVCVCDRKNFNNFLWATMTVFQVRDDKKRSAPCH